MNVKRDKWATCTHSGKRWRWRRLGRERCLDCGGWVRGLEAQRIAGDFVNLTMAQKRALVKAFVAGESSRAAADGQGIPADKVDRFYRVIRSTLLLEQPGLKPFVASQTVEGHTSRWEMARRKSLRHIYKAKAVPIGGRRSQKYVYFAIHLQDRQVVIESGARSDQRDWVRSQVEELSFREELPCPLIAWRPGTKLQGKAGGAPSGWGCLQVHQRAPSNAYRALPARAWAYAPRVHTWATQYGTKHLTTGANYALGIRNRSRHNKEAPTSHVGKFWLYAKGQMQGYGYLPLQYLHLYLAEMAWRFNTRRKDQVVLLWKALLTTDAAKISRLENQKPLVDPNKDGRRRSRYVPTLPKELIGPTLRRI